MNIDQLELFAKCKNDLDLFKTNFAKNVSNVAAILAHEFIFGKNAEVMFSVKGNLRRSDMRREIKQILNTVPECVGSDQLKTDNSLQMVSKLGNRITFCSTNENNLRGRSLTMLYSESPNLEILVPIHLEPSDYPGVFRRKV